MAPQIHSRTDRYSLAGKRSIIELAGAPDLAIALLDCSANCTHLLEGPSTSRPYEILRTIATPNRLTAATQSEESSRKPLLQIRASFRWRSTYCPTLDLAKGGCRIRRWSCILGPQRNQVRVGDQPILKPRFSLRSLAFTQGATHSSNNTKRGRSAYLEPRLSKSSTVDFKLFRTTHLVPNVSKNRISEPWERELVLGWVVATSGTGGTV